MMRAFLILAVLTGGEAVADEEPARSILRTYCFHCHSTEEQKGELDLEASDIRQDPQAWEDVIEQILQGEMPPKKEKQPSEAEKEQLLAWVRRSLAELALANAGDPGPVVLRRLSNHEYTYTLRDLTGVESLDPAREFPVDGAAGEGFTNAGAALVMSPALLAKYLEAAKEVANHLVLLPDGIRFSASDSPQDWTGEALARIRAIHAKHTTSGEEGATVAQGIQLDTGTGSGRLPLSKYLDALQGRGSAEGLSPKYLGILREALEGKTPSLLLDPLRAKFRGKSLVASDIEPWQQVLWRFANVGHIGKENGPKAWQEPVTPLTARHEMRVKLEPDRDVTLYLATTDAGDGAEGDEVIWEQPRLVSPGRPDLPVGEVPQLMERLAARRARILASTETCLNAIAGGSDEADPELVAAWREYLGFGTTTLEPLLTGQLKSTPDYDFIKGWTGEQALSVLANSSDATVRVPGVMKAHGVATHPSPTRAAVIAWRCERGGVFRIAGDVTDAHPECGNGVTWMLEVRRGHTSEVLAKGETKGATVFPLGPFDNVRVEAGQVVALVVGPREGNHVCDLTGVNLTLEDGARAWDLAKEVSSDILAGNPHGPWHFLSQPASLEAAPDVPGPVAAWRREPSPERAAQVRQFLETDFPLNSPLLRAFLREGGERTEPTDLQAGAPSVLEVRIPAAIATGAEFVVTGRLASSTAGSVQMQVLTERPDPGTALVAGRAASSLKPGQWSDNNLVTRHSVPVIVNDDSGERTRFEKAFQEFRDLFPIALCYSRIVPVDEVVTLTLFHREDELLRRLVLSVDEARELDRLWAELLFVSEAPLKQVDVFEQLFQYATQDAKPSAFEPMRGPILAAAETFRRQKRDADAVQREAVVDFAAKAWRRPLTDAEKTSLRAFPPRLMLVRVLTSPAFLYRSEQSRETTGPVSDWELATRLSYFLTSSAPDDELRAAAAAGTLRDDKVLAAQARRLLRSERVRRLATEFGCQYLHVRDVATLDEKSERHFPEFVALRDDMQEEVTRFLIDLFQNDGSVLSLLEADHSFVNGKLGGFYGIGVEGESFQRVEGMRGRGRGGVLGFAATLAKHSGASRTSAILRGTWVSEVILGDKLPNPPKGVPVLPEEAPEGLTERQLIERHSRDANCAGCHRRIDPYGFALEGFDAIGRAREADTKTVLRDGTPIEGLEGLRDYLAGERREDVLRQFCRKLLGYALGRSVQHSDQPLLEELIGIEGHRIGDIVEGIVRSRPFREVRGVRPEGEESASGGDDVSPIRGEGQAEGGPGQGGPRSGPGGENGPASGEGREGGTGDGGEEEQGGQRIEPECGGEVSTGQGEGGAGAPAGEARDAGGQLEGAHAGAGGEGAESVRREAQEEGGGRGQEESQGGEEANRTREGHPADAAGAAFRSRQATRNHGLRRDSLL
jgi:hypothetical protein